MELNQGIKIACLEEISYRMGFLDKSTIIKNAEPLSKNSYYQYVIDCVSEIS